MLGALSTARAAAGSAARALLDLALPRACVACEQLLDAGDRGLVCGRCWARLRELPHPQCARCGHPSRHDRCSWCAQLAPFVRATRSVCWVSEGRGSGAAIVHALKYGGWHALATAMAARMARLAWPPDVVRERTALVPVPLAPVRERERGFNQSALLAQALAAHWHVPVWSAILSRTRATTTQTRLTPEDRRHNVSGAFRVHPAAAPLRGAHLVLVDDVITTGATLGECAGALFDAGARIISMITFGRAPAIGDQA